MQVILGAFAAVMAWNAFTGIQILREAFGN